MYRYLHKRKPAYREEFYVVRSSTKILNLTTHLRKDVSH